VPLRGDPDGERCRYVTPSETRDELFADAGSHGRRLACGLASALQCNDLPPRGSDLASVLSAGLPGLTERDSTRACATKRRPGILTADRRRNLCALRFAIGAGNGIVQLPNGVG
jgi:hypothetical protein